jgi:hypothetical protein
MSAFDEVEEMSPQHFWALAAAFSFAAMLRGGYERVVSHDMEDAVIFLLVSVVIAHVCVGCRRRPPCTSGLLASMAIHRTRPSTELKERA